MTTVEIALVSYTLLILYRNILEGLRSVEQDVREAARGMGLTPLQTLLRIDLPLAAPAIIAGLRIATVSTISIATVAAFVIPAGARPADLRRARPGHLQDGDHRRRRARDPARALGRRAPRRRPARAHAVEEGVILADTFSWGTFPDAIRFIGDHPHLLWDKTLEHLELSGAALGIALAIALPLGVVLGHFHRGSFVAISVSNVGRALPSLVLIAFGILIFGIGFWNNTAALVVLAVPPILTNAYFAVDGIDRNVVEAARGMGMREREILFRVELPLALPLIFAGIRIAAVFVIATATIAAIAGGGGLGEIIVNQASYRLSGVVAASLCVSALAFAVAGLLSLTRKVLSRPFVTGD